MSHSTSSSKKETSRLIQKSRGDLQKFRDQLSLLMYKHALLLLRQWKFTLFRLLYPALIIFLWWVIFYSKVRTGSGVTSTTVTSSIPRCIKGQNQTSCITLLYNSCENSSILELMNIIAKANDPPLTISPKCVTSAEEINDTYDIIGVTVGFDIQSLITEKINYTQSVLDFNNSQNSYCTSCTPDSPNYVVWIAKEIYDPFTLRSFELSDVKSSLLLSVDQALLTQSARTRFNNPDLYTQLQYKYSRGPSYSNQTYSSDWRLFILPLLLWIAIFGDAFIISSSLNWDRTSGIRTGLRMMGLQSGPYWLSWFLIQAIWGIFFSLSVCIMGIITQLPIFIACNFLLLVIIIWLTYTAMSTFTLFLCSWVHNQIGAVSLIVLSFIAGIILVILCSISPDWFFGNKFEDVVFSVWYPLHFGRILHELEAHQEKINQNASIPLYTFSDLTKNTTSGGYYIWPPSNNIGLLIMNILLGIIFAFYFDMVWPGVTGIPQKMLFFLYPSYWTQKKYDEASVELDVYDPKKMGAVLESLDPDIFREHNVTMQRMKDKDKKAMLSILKLSKTFKKGRGVSSQDCRALDDFTSNADQSSIFAILGHNGAGKTTCINILTGLYPPSYGDAFICGHSIVTGMSAIQDMIGVCPQQDIVWPDLTGEEHLRIFCMLKGVPRSERDEMIADRASKVQLTKSLNRKVETYSGGMKRRLSVAISMIGNPKVIFMDEPTTGLDPKNRKEMWSVITSLKEKRLIVLTTHSMTEAEALADKICILALGRLRAVGNTLHLKQRYGAGYRINTIADPSFTDSVKNSIMTIVPTATMESETAGHLLFTVESIQPSIVTNLLHFMETRSNDGTIKEWGFSQTSLEEIFLRVVHGTHMEKDKSIIDPTSETQLNVILEDPSQPPLGFVKVTRNDTLDTARRMIEQLVENAPKRYHFVCNGAPVGLHQEQQIFAMDLAPSLIIRLSSNAITPSTSTEVAETPEIQQQQSFAVIEEYKKRAEESEAKRKETEKELQLAKEENERANRQLREMAERLASIEAMLKSQQQNN